jgi:hypothetical protein
MRFTVKLPLSATVTVELVKLERPSYRRVCVKPILCSLRVPPCLTLGNGPARDLL